jgi:hypothetical protein
MWDDLIVLFLSLALGSFALAAVMFVSDGIRARTLRSRRPSPLMTTKPARSRRSSGASFLPGGLAGEVVARRRNETGPRPKT